MRRCKPLYAFSLFLRSQSPPLSTRVFARSTVRLTRRRSLKKRPMRIMAKTRSIFVERIDVFSKTDSKASRALSCGCWDQYGEH